MFYIKTIFAKKSKSIQGEKNTVEVIEDTACPQCGSQLVIRNGKFGRFIACSGWPRCKYTDKLK